MIRVRSLFVGAGPPPRRSSFYLGFAVMIAVIACFDKNLTGPSDPDDPGGPSLRPLGVVEVQISGVGTPEMSASAATPALHLPKGVRPALAPIPGGGGIQLEPVSTGSFTEGRRGVDGVRYMYATFRVRNAGQDGTPYATARTNLTFIAVKTAGTINETAVARLSRFDGTPADTSIARFVIPTGAVVLNDSTKMESVYPDVMQVYSEATVAAMTPPSGVTNVFPYGFVVRNPSTANSRTLPASPAEDQFDGMVTFAFRVPLQSSSTADPFSVSVMFLAVDDDDTRVTESMEEVDAGAGLAARTRAIALSAPVTVLPGGTTVGYPNGTTQLCDVRTAGLPGAATNTILSPGAYSKLLVLGPSQTLDPCATAFTAGTASSPALDVPHPVTVYARDRYGNTMTHIVDTIAFTAPGFIGTLPTPTALTAGTLATSLTATDYAVLNLMAAGRRKIGAISGLLPLVMQGTRRVWTGDVSIDWSAGGNWDVGAAPRSLDTVVIPTARPQYPVLTQNAQIASVFVESDANINLSVFNLTASGDVLTTGGTSMITSQTGYLVLTGTARTIAGTVPKLRISGTYSLTGNLTTVAPLQVNLGRLRTWSFRIRVNP